MNSGPRDRRHAIAADPPRCRHMSCTEETRGNIVPHKRKNKAPVVYNVGRLNAIVLLSQYSNQGLLTRGPSNCQPPCHVAPLTGVRVDPCGLLPRVAPLAPRVGHARPCHVALVPRHICAGPAHHVSSAHHVSFARHVSVRAASAPPGLWNKTHPPFVILNKK